VEVYEERTMIKLGIDQEPVGQDVREASAQQGEVLRKFVNDVMLKALQGAN